jgi:hypothetical protein
LLSVICGSYYGDLEGEKVIFIRNWDVCEEWEMRRLWLI